MNASRPIAASRDLQEELAEVIGQANVDKLIEHFGGTRTYVPRTVGTHAPLAVVLGLRAALRLCEFFHGRALDLPKAHLRRQRALETALERPEGMTIKDVALAFDYTERQIYKMLAEHQRRADAANDQPGLFDLN